MRSQVVEWAPFELKPGVTEEQLLQASSDLQRDFVSQQEGFVSRRLVRGRDGAYADIVVWACAQSARRAMESAANSATCAAFFGLMKPEQGEAGAGVEIFTTVEEYRLGAGGE